jgi:hypothetical protein
VLVGVQYGVMTALVAGIHVFFAGAKDVDGRNKSGHDELEAVRVTQCNCTGGTPFVR